MKKNTITTIVITIFWATLQISYANFGMHSFGRPSFAPPSDAPNCYRHAMFENDLSDREAFELCASSEPSPSLCYTFAKKMLSKEGALGVCKKTPSLMTIVNCLVEKAQGNYLQEDEIVEGCRFRADDSRS